MNRCRPLRRVWSAVVLAVLAVATAPGRVGPVAADCGPEGRTYDVSLTAVLKEKSFKFYIRPADTRFAVDLRYCIGGAAPPPAGAVAGARDARLSSLRFSWETTGLSILKEITPDAVRLRDNGAESIEWKRGEKRPGETNPLELLAGPLLKLTATAGDGARRVEALQDPERSVGFMRNLRFGRFAELHRPGIPAGAPAAGRSWTEPVRVPDGTYSAVEWEIPVTYEVKEVSGSGARTEVQIEGHGAATRDRTESRMGPLTDGTVSLTSRIRALAAGGELLEGTTELFTRWKKDPSVSPTGIMDYAATVRVTEGPTPPAAR
jgi:hypothetical protein